MAQPVAQRILVVDDLQRLTCTTDRSPQVPAMLVADAGEGLRLASGAVDKQVA